MKFCSDCNQNGYCRKKRTRIVSADELTPEYVRDLRGFALGLDVPFRRWPDYIVDGYRDYPGWIASWAGQRIELNLDVFERPHIEFWFRSFCCTPVPADVRPRVRIEAVPRVIVLATILKAIHPEQAKWWGMRPANDNDPNFKDGGAE